MAIVEFNHFKVSRRWCSHRHIKLQVWENVKGMIDTTCHSISLFGVRWSNLYKCIAWNSIQKTFALRSPNEWCIPWHIVLACIAPAQNMWTFSNQQFEFMLVLFMYMYNHIHYSSVHKCIFMRQAHIFRTMKVPVRRTRIPRPSPRAPQALIPCGSVGFVLMTGCL